jgi:hypothetical protein
MSQCYLSGILVVLNKVSLPLKGRKRKLGLHPIHISILSIISFPLARSLSLFVYVCLSLSVSIVLISWLMEVLWVLSSVTGHCHWTLCVEHLYMAKHRLPLPFLPI